MGAELGYEIFASIVIIAVFGAVILALFGIDPSGYINMLPALVIVAFIIGLAVTVGKTASSLLG
ncbi:hypothetical protein HSRCO_3011 (plasmid) [Halanaeroarchaeum sp. HSR-CO]|uniref:hypothetical protein n=1 Tax=Halanaeroarchaeum sp. HSR-CO TaxID=2866382 RepID=UPI00217F20BE|nr:hypothetical protein [Halanaeroarchaeum sp. HSR-CO]UWG49152.1 hypothetical protein HSRCO_3011 [Halanaeroarchaeum sp. HSR-CO]